MAEKETKRYWKSPQERDGDAGVRPASGDEFPEPPAAGRLPRRDFLKAAGFTLAVGVAAGCSRAPVEEAIPLLVQQEEIVPGRSLFYASTCGACSAGCGLLAKVRDGRPIKLEGNPEHPVARGGLCAVGQASLLGLYDSQRLAGPQRAGQGATWAEVDEEITARVQSIRAQGGAVRVLSGAAAGPALTAAIQEFLGQFRDGRHVIYQTVSRSSILDAHRLTHGARVLPRYRFERAEVIAAFDADFLGGWISPVEHTAGYGMGRDLQSAPPRVSWHAQFEPRLTLSGSKADRRFALRPGQISDVLAQVAWRLAQRAGQAHGAAPAAAAALPEPEMEDVVGRLWQARGRCLAVCGSQQVRDQVLVNLINQALGNYGATLDVESPSQQAQESDGDLAALLEELKEDRVQALFLHQANPLFDLPGQAELREALARVPLLVSFAERLDESAAVAHYVCPDHHFLESWGDAESVAGYVSLTQPVLRPLGGTRALLTTLAAWSGRRAEAYDLLREHWAKHIHPRRRNAGAFEAFWNQSVHDGGAEVEAGRVAAARFAPGATRDALSTPAPAAAAAEFDLVLYPKVGLPDGRHAYNPWLHELPDPVSKVTWDNYACLSPAAARRLGVKDGDGLRVEDEAGNALELPALLQPGQHEAVVAVALGYGSRLSARFAEVGPRWLHARSSVGTDGVVGVNAAPLLHFAQGTLQRSRSGVRLRATGKKHRLAATQHHHSLTVPGRLTPPDGQGPRPIVQETTLAAFLKDPHAGVFDHEFAQDLWSDPHKYPGHRWGMVLDLNACSGCSACVIACQAENNVPVVGKDEVRRHREMQWLRVDRYYAETAAGVDVVFQPMLCQQCDHAPCETVCPVIATVHSREGLNEQIYNRCIGTRYCANNCPYKARRFNWFNYVREDKLQNLVLNPDVTVRFRGVMEKCTFCVQRIQEAKIEARRHGRAVGDGDVQTACQQSCPAQAIVFGDLNDPQSRVSRMMEDPRRYRVLSELNVKPSVGYLTIVRNRDEEEGAARHG